MERILTWVTALIVPFFLLMTAIRLLFTPLYPQVVYRLPGFPPDQYGFSLEDRLHWSRISIEYLLNDQGIDYLAKQQLPTGQPLYNDRELSHMVDVKVLVQKMIIAWDILLAVLAIFAIWAWRAHWLPAFLHGLGRGGMFTIGLVVLILAGVAISFQALFTGFHEIFFTGNSWLFYWTDSLIRLFPLPFWEIGFILMGTFTIVGSLILIWLDRHFAYR
jgi:integral membrane protein (TIGR01906 family)